MTMTTPIFLARLIVAASLAALVAAYLSQYVGGLEPCPLCLLQRIPYGLTIFLGASALLLIGRGHSPVMLIAVIGGIFVLNAGIAFYHVGVEQDWFGGLAACAGGGATPGTVDDLRTMLLDQPPLPPCDLVQWSLFGVSMAGYNMLFAIIMATISLIGAASLHRNSKEP